MSRHRWKPTISTKARWIRVGLSRTVVTESSPAVSAWKWSFQPDERHSEQDQVDEVVDGMIFPSVLFCCTTFFYIFLRKIPSLPAFPGVSPGRCGLVQKFPPRGNRSNFLIKSKSLSCTSRGDFFISPEAKKKKKWKSFRNSPSRNKEQPHFAKKKNETKWRV